LRKAELDERREGVEAEADKNGLVVWRGDPGRQAINRQ
jgi:hypothetical protein